MAGLLNLGALPQVGDGNILGGLGGLLPGGVVGDVLDPITGVVGGVTDRLSPVTSPVFDTIDGLSPIGGLIGDTADKVTPILSGSMAQLLGENTALGGLLGTVGTAGTQLLAGLTASVSNTTDALGDLLGGLGGKGGNGGNGGVTVITINGGSSLTGTPGNDFIQGGAGNDKLFGGAGDDILDGAGGFDIAVYQGNHTDYAVSAAGGGLTVKDQLPNRDGADTLRAIEFLQFKDGGIDLASNTFVPQEILNQSAEAYRGVVRLDAPGGVAETIGSGIAQEKFTFDAYVDALIRSVEHSTMPALLVAGLVTGTIPTSEKLDTLAAFAQQQYDYYSNVLGSASASLGPYEALGRGFSATPEFRAKYGDASDGAFVSQAYLDIFGSAPSDAQKAALNAQLGFFEKLYAGNGYAPAQAEIQARGAVFGQIIGYAAEDTKEAHHANAEVVLTGIANGDTSHYGAAFG